MLSFCNTTYNAIPTAISGQVFDTNELILSIQTQTQQPLAVVSAAARFIAGAMGQSFS
jgi:hypothetical protein